MFSKLENLMDFMYYDLMVELWFGPIVNSFPRSFSLPELFSVLGFNAVCLRFLM